MSNHHARSERTERPFVAGMVRKLSVPIILGWLAITLLVSVGVPSLEQVAKEHAVSHEYQRCVLGKGDGAHRRRYFKESDSDSVAMVVLEGDQPLGDAAHRYYDALIRQLRADPKHVQHHPGFLGGSAYGGAARKALTARLPMFN